MKQHNKADKAAKRDLVRVAAINESLLEHDMPIVTHGVLYMDGEGTASAPVAKRAAELFNAGDYECVVMAGGKYPWIDRRALPVFPKVLKEKLPLPKLWHNEGQYLAGVFKTYADPDKYAAYQKAGKIHVIPRGGNAGAKVNSCKDIFNEVGLVQCVTLPYTVPRLVGTIGMQAPGVVATGHGVWPFGLQKDNWHEWGVAYGVVLGEADKTGPRLDGQKPTYLDKFFVSVDLEQAGKRAVQLDQSFGL